MPHVEILPNSTTTTAAPGWAYVPDTGFDPSKAAIVPTGSRKRARNITTSSLGASGATGAGAGRAGLKAAAANRADVSARQASKVAKHLAELEKENHRDVQIAVPAGTGRDAGNRGLRGKMTTGVKKIVSSQKTFANHLADEEAAIANQQHHPIEPIPFKRPMPNKKASKGRGKGRPSTSKTDRVPDEDMIIVDQQQDTQQELAPSNQVPEPQDTEQQQEVPFLRNPMPSLPSDAELELLLSAPALSYNAARAAPSASTAPPRLFCEICGYWGRARCMKCGVRVCGLECKNTHEETRCLKFYA